MKPAPAGILIIGCRSYMGSETALAILKPDTIRDSLDNLIIEDIESANLQVVNRKILQINPCEVEQIYPDKVESPLFSSTTWAITFGPSMLLLINGESAHSKLKDLKGKMNTHGIRHKYRRYSKDKLIEIGYEGVVLQNLLFENRIHTCDDVYDSSRICSLFYSAKELNGLNGISPRLRELSSRETSLCRITI